MACCLAQSIARLPVYRKNADSRPCCPRRCCPRRPCCPCSALSVVAYGLMLALGAAAVGLVAGLALAAWGTGAALFVRFIIRWDGWRGRQHSLCTVNVWSTVRCDAAQNFFACTCLG